MKLSIAFNVLLLMQHVFFPPSFAAAVDDEDEIKMPCMMRGKGCDNAASIKVDDLDPEKQNFVTASASRSESDDIKGFNEVFLKNKLTSGFFDGEDPNFQKHPFVMAVEDSCSDEIKRCGNGDISSFYPITSCLEELHSKGEVGDRCKESIFSANGENPNKDLFEFAYIGTQVYIGYLKAPLIYSNPDKTPMTNVWFGVIPCRKQPAPKGMLFQHNGGPLAGLGSFGPVGFTESIYNNYDFVMVDQRGMGLSYISTVYGLQTVLGLNINEMLRYSGVFGSGPLYSLMENVDDKDSFQPQDYTDEDAMYKYLMKKQQAAVECSKIFDRQDNKTSTKYNILQYYGTQALSYDIEWLRWAFGFPKVSILGFSYGSRVAADYASRFPQSVRRVAVSGVMAPDPNLLSYAKKAADNTREIFAFLQSNCNEVGEECTSNPFPKNATDYYFSGDANEALTELANRSAPNSTFYEDECGEENAPVPFRYITQYLAYRLTSMVVAQNDFLDRAWPRAMLEIPAVVFAMVQNPCKLRGLLVGENTYLSDISVFTLIPALDMTGHASAKQVAKFVSSKATDILFSPSLSMFSLYAISTFGWPQFSTPITFSNPDVEVAIGQSLYDQRTGMNMAQDFARNFPNSRMAVAPVSGHCVSPSHGPEAFEYMMRFLLFNKKFPNGFMTDMPPKSMPFGEVAENFVSLCNKKGLEYCLWRKRDNEQAEFKEIFAPE